MELSGDMASDVTNQSAKRVQFGSFEADLNTGELRRSGIRIRLQSQPFRLLAILVEHRGELVSRETLQSELWGTHTVVDFEHGLGMAINRLRDALGDSAGNPRFVETVARRGYRFIAPVTVIESQANFTPVVASPAVSPNPRTSFWPWLAAALAVLSLILGVLLFLQSGIRVH